MSRKGFTIVELLIAVVVIATLAAITIVSYNGITKQARQAVVSNDARTVIQKIETHKALTDEYPASISSCPVPAADSLCLPQQGRLVYKFIPAVDTNGNYTRTLSPSYEVTVKGDGAVVYFSPAEKTTVQREFMQYTNLAPIIDHYGLVSYKLSFDIKSASTANTNKVRVYFQNGSTFRYGGLQYDAPVTTEWQRREVVFTPVLVNADVVSSSLAFFGVYDSGNIPTVRNVRLELN